MAQTRAAPADWKPSPAYQLLEFALEATAREVDRVARTLPAHHRDVRRLGDRVSVELRDAKNAMDAAA